MGIVYSSVVDASCPGSVRLVRASRRNTPAVAAVAANQCRVRGGVAG